MKLAHARSVLSMVRGGILKPGALWISGILDDAPEAERTVRRAEQRAARAAAKKTSKTPKKKKVTRVVR